MASVVWEAELAAVYDDVYAWEAEPSVVEPIAVGLAALAGGGAALEFAVGTGRVALALSARGVAVTGIELSAHMAERLRAKPGADAVPVIVGDMTTTRVDGSFALIYLVANSIMNVTTQDEQLAIFGNAAAHLGPGGRFVVSVIVPRLQEVAPGVRSRVFTHSPDHVGIETFDDPVGQIAWSHHWMAVGGRLVRHSAPYRYVWPSELDLMARLAGFCLEDRWADWHQSPFTADSTSHITVYKKRGALAPPLEPEAAHACQPAQ
ncbi:MAG: class I SAM-dependent methyltransferase [Streptosporangiaceae bacterium]